MLLGGKPFEAAPMMWWNYVARTAAEVQAAHDDWQAGSDRFGSVASTLPRGGVDTAGRTATPGVGAEVSPPS